MTGGIQPGIAKLPLRCRRARDGCSRRRLSSAGAREGAAQWCRECHARCDGSHWSFEAARQTPHRPRWPSQGKRTSPVGTQLRSSTSWGRRLRVPYRDDGRRCSHWALSGTGPHRHESVDAWPCDARSRGIREVRWREYRVCASHSKQNSCESATIEFRSDSFEEDRSLRTGPEGLTRTVSNDQRDPLHR